MEIMTKTLLLMLMPTVVITAVQYDDASTGKTFKTFVIVHWLHCQVVLILRLTTA